MVLVLYTGAIYRMNATDGSYKKLSGSSWKGTKGAVNVGNDKVLVVCRDAIYTVIVLQVFFEGMMINLKK